MLKLSSHIIIESDKTWEFTAVHDCVIVEDTATLTDTCELKLPRHITWEGYTSQYHKPPAKRGDRITVKLGYDGDLKVRFSGYVRRIDAKTPITLYCEDGMFLLKQMKAEPKAFKNATLEQIIKHLLNGSNIAFNLIDDNIKVGNWRITKANVSEELQELKEKMMLTAYFRLINGKSVLYIGLKYPFDNRKKGKFQHGKNIISEDFEYRDKAEIRVRVEAQSFDKKNKKITYEYGDKDGEVIKIRIDGLTAKELEKYAMQVIERYKQSGFKGSFETFGVPEMSKCDMMEIHASDGNSGTYLIKRNEVSFGINGYRQKIELGDVISTNKTE
ncbi:STN domain-containing protein [Candidatus Ornithobacterium hominis]|uniref:hypothetical protein n=1 Tax=Candidatus Ornithobacterium hominis TaxID=2497989 RepID=UPI0024BC5EAB|nr:hypothetical protein [Candidatus Ornithobacterium hominis]CAI9429265.1 STN domain-containing protein [Candidatus Ornithobacterium hominis]